MNDDCNTTIWQRCLCTCALSLSLSLTLSSCVWNSCSMGFKVMRFGLFPTITNTTNELNSALLTVLGTKLSTLSTLKATLPCCSACQVSLPICWQHVRVERKLRHSLSCRGAHTSSYSSCVALTKPRAHQAQY